MLDIFLVIIFFAVAAGYLGRRLVKSWRTDNTESCAGCGCPGGCSLDSRKREQENAK
jgi:hypothetical protein